MDNAELQKKIAQLEKNFFDLSQQVYLNNFSAHQDFNKKCNFNTGLKVPHYDSVPTKAEVGEIIEVGGTLLICSSENIFSIVGTQT